MCKIIYFTNYKLSFRLLNIIYHHFGILSTCYKLSLSAYFWVSSTIQDEKNIYQHFVKGLHSLTNKTHLSSLSTQ